MSMRRRYTNFLRKCRSVLLVYAFITIVTLLFVVRYMYSEKSHQIVAKQAIFSIQMLENGDENTVYDVTSRPVLKECEELSENEAFVINEILLDRRKVFLENQQYLNERFANIAEEAGIEPGGVWKPRDCMPQHQLILVIPYRNRSEQLTYFLPYIHEFLQYQKISYRIIIVEQSEEKKFNRGKLMNVGYVEGLKLDSTQPCFAFHDVDFIPENIKSLYYCYDKPLHLTWCVDYRNYTTFFEGFFGGAVTMLASQFKLINGFSNSFWGWGGEDDDLLERIMSKLKNYTSYNGDIARYTMLKHPQEERSKIRYFVLNTRKFVASVDGLKNLNYTVLDYQLKPLYTWIKVRL